MDTLVPDWLNENTLRAYPLREAISRLANTNYRLTDTVILDAQLVYTTMPAASRLTSITVSGDNVSFIVSSKTFVASKIQAFPQYIRHEDGSLLVIGDGILSIPEGLHLFANVYFEPSVSYEFGGDWLGVTGVSFDNGNVLTGDITLKEGLQCDLDIQGSTISVGVSNSYGEPVTCTNYGSTLNDCSTIISFINGVGPDTNGVLRLSPGSGITILDDPINHIIYVGLAFSADDVCKTIISNPGA